jgi:NitT/TauT family transport system ATP-binding protein
MIQRNVKITLSDVSKTYVSAASEHEIEAVSGVNFEVYDNDFLVMIGPSGCGKSTVLSMMAGLLQPTGGQILVDGGLLLKPNPKKIALMFQEHLLLPWRTVTRNIAFGLEPQNLPQDMVKERVAKYLKMVNLESFADVYPHQLSGGMKQRVALCRALAIEAEILLMDEPFGALDEQTRMILSDELVDIWSKVKRTIVFITHSLNEAAYLGERIAIFSERPGKINRIVEVNSPRPRDLSSKELMNVFQILWTELRMAARKEGRNSLNF